MKEPRVEVDKQPTAEEEAAEFETADERRQAKQYAHELKMRGWLGNIIGSNNTPLNLAFVMLMGLFVLIFLCVGGGLYRGLDEKTMHLIERLVSALLAVGAFIFGVNQRGR